MVKLLENVDEAIADVADGSTIMFGGFGVAGIPFTLIKALQQRGTKDITVITNSPGGRLGELDLSILFKDNQVSKVIASYPIYPGMVNAFEKRYLDGQVELELVPQGTLVERIRAGGAGIPGFYTPTGVGTIAEEGKEKKTINNREYLLEMALRADFAFIKAHKTDQKGNLTYRMTARNFNPLMAMAAEVTIAEVEEIVETGDLDPEYVITPHIFVDRIVKGETHDFRFK
ncbi:MAG TPA: CoA transferase subunit A [Dehalococcoidia bacterium]|nr:CoA transferase subunit A [Dehalococcoidia bacterium]